MFAPQEVNMPLAGMTIKFCLSTLNLLHKSKTNNIK